MQSYSGGWGAVKGRLRTNGGKINTTEFSGWQFFCVHSTANLQATVGFTLPLALFTCCNRRHQLNEIFKFV